MADALQETRTLRRRLEGIQTRGRRESAQTATYCQAVEVYDAGHIPTTVPNQFSVKPIRATGRIGEGLSATITTGSTGFVATFLGPKVPVVGDRYVVRQAGGRWVADGGPPPPACGNLCVLVTGCSQGFPDCRVDLWLGGVNIATGTSVVGLGSITAISGGTGYVAGSTTISFSGGGGSGAAVTPVISGGQIVAYTITNRGFGYTSPPTMTITSATGHGATFTINMAGYVCFDISSTGTYTYIVTPPDDDIGARYGTFTGTMTIATCNGTNRTAAAVMPVDSAYVCCSCLKPISKTLTLTTSEGTVTATWNSLGFAWTASQTITRSMPTYNPATTYFECNNATTQTATVAFKVSCVAITQSWTGAVCCLTEAGHTGDNVVVGDGHSGATNATGGGASTVSYSFLCPDPWTQSGSFPTTIGTSGCLGVTGVTKVAIPGGFFISE